MINNLYIDAGSVSLNKYKEQLCGDNVEIVREKDDMVVAVLADGLGSGVKANILSILTSKIVSTMIANDINIYTCIKTIASILPICSVRKIAYSTFSAVKISNNEIAEIIEFDNPQVIVLRNGKYFPLDRTSTKIEDKIIYTSKFRLELNDTIILISDGVVYAGVGFDLNFGWQRDDVIKYIENKYSSTFTAKTIASIITDKCNELYENTPGDDTTCCVLKVLEKKSVNILIGPPINKEDDEKMARLFFAKGGKHIVCGGTTAAIASRYLHAPIDNNIDLKQLTKDVPPISHIEGVDLVTEGVVTINKVLFYINDYLKNNEYYYYWIGSDDGASQITRLLIEDATDINFYVGKAINPAHQNPDLKIDFSIKMKLIEELTKGLERIGKKTTVSYF